MSVEENKNKVNSFRTVRIAAIMDDFTWNSYSPEADMYQLKPDNVISQLEENVPELLFVESAWHGADGLWYRKISNCSAELMQAVKWCKSRNIPTVFWNKEDPVHFSTFRETALNFDYIFTYDFNCVEKYKSLTGKHNAFYLPMGVQPKLFNPIEKYQRLDKFCFAGSYYVRYRERTEDLDDYIKYLPDYKDIDIYDRQFGKNDPNYMFPENYQKYIRGCLSYTEVDKAYKGYNYSINLNSIKQAQSCARRVFELFACNTFIVSNYCIGVKTLFGDLMLVSDSGKDIVRRLRNLDRDPLTTDRLRLLGLRKVFTESTYEDRLAYILHKTGIIKEHYAWQPEVTVWSRVRDRKEYSDILKMFRNQSYGRKRLVILSDSADVTASSTGDGDTVFVKTADELPKQSESGFFACFSAKNFYDRNYLLDLMLATRYDDTGNYVKSSVFESRNQKIERTAVSDRPYTYTDSVIPDEAVLNRRSFLNHLAEIVADSHKAVSENGLRTDSFNYCRNLRADDITSELRNVFSDNEETTDCGYSVTELQQIAEKQPIKKQKSDENMKKLSAAFIYEEIEKSLAAKKRTSLFDRFASLLGKKKQPERNIVLRNEKDGLALDYELPATEHDYLLLKKKFEVSELTDSGELRLYLRNRGTRVGLAYYLYENGKKISSKLCQPNTNVTADLPDNVTHIRLGLRIAEKGNSVVENIYLEECRDLFTLPGKIFNKHKTVIVVHHYPSYKDIYRYGFVHSRVRGYIRKGEKPLVFVLVQNSAELIFSEYEGVDVITGNNEALDKILNDGVDTVLTHFMTPAIWESLGKLPENIKIFVWCHGADVLLFDRRSYNYVTEDEIRKGHITSDGIRDFWTPIFKNLPANLHFVFVSEFLAEVVMQDLGIRLPEGRYSIIHNPIDTSIFKYHEKKPEDRYRILSIRPFATRMYANDQTMNAINLLAKRPDFSRFEILLVGDGKLFDETVAILNDYPNVKIRRCFLNHYEIAELHTQYGVFLCPSRYDTQGVSRDEARASGLVPVTTSIAAIPEFVNSETAMLAEPENPTSLAKAIGTLADNPDMFVKMSRKTSEEAVKRLSMDGIIEQELSLFRK